MMKKLFNVKVVNILIWVQIIGSLLITAYDMITMFVVTNDVNKAVKELK